MGHLFSTFPGQTHIMGEQIKYSSPEHSSRNSSTFLYSRCLWLNNLFICVPKPPSYSIEGAQRLMSVCSLSFCRSQ